MEMYAFSHFFLKKGILVLLCDNPILGKEIESCNNIHANRNTVCTPKYKVICKIASTDNYNL